MAADDNVILVLRHVFAASAEFLFDAWTDPRLLARWFFAQPQWTAEVVACDLRVGGAWEIVMHGDDGKDCRTLGKYLAIERPRRLVFTWLANAQQDYETVVTLVFKPLDEHTTELLLTHTGLRNDRDRDEHRRGWEGCLQSLQRLQHQEKGT